MVLNQAEDDFAMIKVHVSDDFINYDRFREIVRSLNFDATPGYPLCRSFATVGDLFKWDGFNFSEDSVLRFWHEWKIWLENPIQFPFRMFIKDEPISKEKYDLGRWRLIFASPLYYQILDHFLFDDMNNMEMEAQWLVPTKLQWHPFWGGAEIGVSTFDRPASIDKSMWDWTMLEDFVLLDKDFRKSRVLKAPQRWYDLVDLSYKLAYEQATFVFSSGLVFEQPGIGLMKSGLLNTLTTNSHCQYFIHVLCSNKCQHRYKFWTIGDDVLMTYPCDLYLREMSRFSKVKKVDPECIFAGFNLKNKEPCYWSKHYNRLLFSADEQLAEILDSYQRLYAFCDKKLDIIQDLLYQYDFTKLRTKRYLKYWATEKMNLDKFLIYR